MNPVLSIITGTRNRPDDFRRLVRSVEQQTNLLDGRDAMPYEVIICDASDNPIDVHSMSLPANVKVIPERPRLGFSRGMNVACKQAQGRWTMILNDDCEVLPGYAEAAVGFMESHPQIGLGALPYSEKGGPFVVNGYWGMAYANFPILSTELGNRIGWFDESLPFYGSDNALTCKVLLAGHGVDGIPGARIIHHATDDQHRRENNGNVERIREAESLRDKYGPYIQQMMHVYRITQSGKTIAPHDQTPSWMWPKVMA